jgi:hypothetical protein
VAPLPSKPLTKYTDASPFSSFEPEIQIEHSLSASLKNSLDILNGIEKLPSCPKMATAALLHTCSTLEGHSDANGGESETGQGTDMFLDDSMTLYATRLAVCEIQSAGSSVPKACQAFIPTARTSKKTTWGGYLTVNGATKPRQLYPEYEDATEHDLKQCVAALHGQPQTWTSFSNSKQNAVLICHSMRGEVEKDQQIHLHKILSSTTHEVVNALFQSKKEWASFKADYAELSHMMRQSHMDLSEGNDKMRAAALRFWEEWESHMQDLTGEIQKAKAAVDAIVQAANNGKMDTAMAVQELQTQMKEVAVLHRSNKEDMSQNIEAVQDFIDYVTEVALQQLSQQIYKVTGDMDTMNLAVSQHHQYLDGFNTSLMSAGAMINNFTARLDDVDTSIEQVERRAQSAMAKLEYALDLVNRGLATLQYWSYVLLVPLGAIAVCCLHVVYWFFSTFIMPMMVGPVNLLMACFRRTRIPRSYEESPAFDEKVMRLPTTEHQTARYPDLTSFNNPQYWAQKKEQTTQV